MANVGLTHTIAGKILRVKGFDICSSCGKVQNIFRNNPNNHTHTCRFRDKPEQAKVKF